MKIKIIHLAAVIIFFAFFGHAAATAQMLTPGDEADSPSGGQKFEVGAQFPSIHVDNDPVALASNARRSEPGVGGRFAYNLSRHVALESEVNFFPRQYRGFLTPLTGGRITQGLFGAKVGARGRRFGVFGKARPGFMRHHTTVERVRFPDGSGPDPRDPFGFEFGSTTHLAVDLGGVVEVYTTRRTVLRFDVGDTVVRYAGIPVFNSVRGLIEVTEYQHNAQFSAGFGFRF